MLTDLVDWTVDFEGYWIEEISDETLFDVPLLDSGTMTTDAELQIEQTATIII